MPIQLAQTPGFADVDYPVELFSTEPLGQDDMPEGYQGDDGWEAACQWLADRRVLQDINQWEIGWMGQRVQKRYGEASRAKWAAAGGYKPGTIGRYISIAQAFTPTEVRQIGEVAPNFSFKHAEYLKDFKTERDADGELLHDWEEVMDVVEQVGAMNWSAETMRKFLRGEEEDQNDAYGKPFMAVGQLHFDEVWVDTPDGRVKKAALMILMDEDAIMDILTKASNRGFDEQLVEAIIKFPKDE